MTTANHRVCHRPYTVSLRAACIAIATVHISPTAAAVAPRPSNLPPLPALPPRYTVLMLVTVHILEREWAPFVDPFMSNYSHGLR